MHFGLVWFSDALEAGCFLRDVKVRCRMSVNDDGRLYGWTNLIDELDERVLMVLTDGKHVCGKVVSFDRFGNIILEDVSERYYSKDKVAEVFMGCMIVRSENVAMVGTIDEDKEKLSPLKLVSPEELEEDLEDDSQVANKSMPAMCNFDV